MPIKEDEPLKQKIWQTYQTFVFNFLKNGGTDTNPLKNTLNTFIDENKICSSSIDYGLVTIEMNTNIAHELFKEDIPQGKMIDYIIDWVMKNTSILHFCGKRKPWRISYSNRFATLYKHYMQITFR